MVGIMIIIKDGGKNNHVQCREDERKVATEHNLKSQKQRKNRRAHAWIRTAAEWSCSKCV